MFGFFTILISVETLALNALKIYEILLHYEKKMYIQRHSVTNYKVERSFSKLQYI